MSPKPRVLVVDDCPRTRKLICEMLACEGYSSLEAPNGQDGLEILWKSEEPLIAVLDYAMALMNGVEVLRYLAEDPVRARRHAIVLMSAHSHYPDMARQVFPYEPLPFIHKPFTFEGIIRVIEDACELLCRNALKQV